MNATNWPGGVDRSNSNWTGRIQRTSSDWGGAWAPNSHRIPASGWVGAIAVVVMLFAIIPFIGRLAGF
ncbi:hypothetical protein V8Z80_08335 [Orrella sp. JC864]|uniref:hypothetical protein n=1 Tax=Orrella sp. JC864 TaxID=3120298 RepID=UPI00300BD047